MGLLLFSPAAHSQSPVDSALTGLIGIHLNTSSSNWLAVQQPNRSNAPQSDPQHNLAPGQNEKRADLEVSLYLMEGRLVPREALALAMRTAAQILTQAGVRLRWLDKAPYDSSKSQNKPCSYGITAPLIVMNFGENPGNLEPDVVAQARPYAQGGVRITFPRALAARLPSDAKVGWVCTRAHHGPRDYARASGHSPAFGNRPHALTLVSRGVRTND